MFRHYSKNKHFIRANLSVMGFWVPFDQNGGWGYGGVLILGNR